MAVGIALLLDLAARVPRGSLHTHATLSAATAASAAAALAASGVPLSARYLFGKVAYCDAGATYVSNDTPDLVNDLNNKIFDSIHDISTHDLQSSIKEYPLELKPLGFAFSFKHLSLTTLRAFLLYYLPLLEPRPPTDDEDDDDLLQDDEERPPVDLVTPFHKSLQQIARETSVVTTRRILERIAVRHVSDRTAWKLLKVHRGAWKATSRRPAAAGASGGFLTLRLPLRRREGGGSPDPRSGV